MKEALRTGAARLVAAGVDTAQLDARLLLEHALGISREALVAAGDRALSDTEQATYKRLLARREKREPVSHILGWREFYGLRFAVTRDVLTPRPDTEAVVEAVLERVPDRNAAHRVLDLGTGTGCLLLALLHALPRASGMGVDISAAALAVAKRNADELQLADRAEFLRSDWCGALPQKKYQIIVANPPYIASNALRALMPEVAVFEPHLALDGGLDGLASYRKIAQALPPYLAKDAMVATEAGAGQDAAIASIFEGAGFRVEAVRHDLSGVLRCLVFRR